MKHAQKIDIDCAQIRGHGFPVLEFDGVEGSDLSNAGVGDDDIDGPIPRDGEVEHGHEVVPDGDVAFESESLAGGISVLIQSMRRVADGVCLPPSLFDLPHRLQPTCDIPIANHDFGARGEKCVL